MARCTPSCWEREIATAKWGLLLFLGGVFSIPVIAQTPPAPLITQSINEAKVITLRGNVHPLAQARYDVGAAPASTPARRLMFLLNRPADRKSSLAEYMQSIHTPDSVTYHKWLTPEEFGSRFGPADSDIQQVSDWLSGIGFQVAGTSKGKTLIEFSGTVALVNKAFHTQIRKYAIDGEVHYANATDPQIPESLAGIVRGVSSLNDFRPRSNLHVVGPAHIDPATRKISPDFTLTGPNGTIHAVAPEDFATQYNVAPLYAAGIKGTGETIGIINDSNIDVNLDEAYRSLFKLPANPTQVVLDGGDPGITGDAIEAYLDVEMAGAVAPDAIVNLYIASWDTVATALNDPLILAARRAIEDNQADVLSVSFSECEGDIGTADNLILAALWEQASAQGQTVFVSTGDSGSAGCDNADTQQEAIYGLQVNGFASTPWNVAVGGTDFYYSDYATGAPSAASLWNATNDANLGSLKAPLPEQVWNDSFGFDAVNVNDTEEDHYLYTIDAGSGGASGCINSVASTPGSALPFVCSPVSGTIYGYAKPSWQSGPGVPSDGVRDLPDVSLFAANGYNLSAYPICASPGDCTSGANQQTLITLVGGTSASAPAMAAIMALIDQKYGRQGQADYTFYALAQQKPSAFHDITLGGNNVPCLEDNGVLSPNCILNTGGVINPTWNTLSGYSAATGYDLASGLGSVDANVLVTNWGALTFAPTSTSLQLSPNSFAHGTTVELNVSVESFYGGEKPQGGISILTNSPLPTSQSVDFLTVGGNGSASGSINFLPGGTYQVWADYGGDGLHASSNSSPVSVTVTPEASSIALSAWSTFDYESAPSPAVGCTPVVGNYETPVSSGSAITVGTPLWLAIKPMGATSALATATGSATFTWDGQPESVPLNVLGIATWVTPPTAGPGVHKVIASYSGDASYGSSTSLPFTYTVQQLQPIFRMNYSSVSSGAACNTGSPCNAYAGDNFPVQVTLYGGDCNLATGTITATLGSQTQTLTLSPEGFPAGQILTGITTFPNVQAGTYQLSATYSGDTNYKAASQGPFTITVAPSSRPLVHTTVVASVDYPVIALGSPAYVTLTATVSGGVGSNGPPTGTIDIYRDGENSFSINLTPSGPNSAMGSYSIPDFNNDFYFGLNQFIAVYGGDPTYQGSVSPPVQVTVVTTAVTPDFILAPQLNQITVQSGTSATVAINVAPQNEFSGAVTLTCAPSSSQVTCSLNPPTVSLSGPVTATLSIITAAQSSNLPAYSRPSPDPGGFLGWLVASSGFILASVLAGGLRRRKRRLAMLLSLGLFAAVFFAAGCGSGGGSQKIQQPPPPPPDATTYSVVVSATAANGIVHNAKIAVVVP